jgi:hypothetical protein
VKQIIVVGGGILKSFSTMDCINKLEEQYNRAKIDYIERSLE